MSGYLRWLPASVCPRYHPVLRTENLADQYMSGIHRAGAGHNVQIAVRAPGLAVRAAHRRTLDEV
jgi:hypothetical protein